MSQAIIVPADSVDAGNRSSGPVGGFPDREDLSTFSPVLVVLPTYNEAEGIRLILDQLMASPVQPEVLVVDDSSPDGTAAIVEAIAAQNPGRIHLMVRRDKDGLGGAYRAGFAWALQQDYAVMVQMDADGSHPVDRLPALVAALHDGADVAIGSRYVPGGGVVNWPAHRRGLSRFGNWYSRTLLDLPQHDCTGHYRAWRTEALRIADPCALTTSGYGFAVELVTTAHRRGLTFAEVPITFVDRVLGESKMNTAIAMEAMTMVWRLRHIS